MEFQVFNLISKLKGIKKAKLIVDDEDNFYIKTSYKRVKQHLSYKKWRKIVINYSIDSLDDIFTSCNILIDVIVKKYEKHGN